MRVGPQKDASSRRAHTATDFRPAHDKWGLSCIPAATLLTGQDAPTLLANYGSKTLPTTSATPR